MKKKIKEHRNDRQIMAPTQADRECVNYCCIVKACMRSKKNKKVKAKMHSKRTHRKKVKEVPMQVMQIKKDVERERKKKEKKKIG